MANPPIYMPPFHLPRSLLQRELRKFWPYITKIIRAAVKQRVGGIYLVGGIIRDIFLRRPLKNDIDIVINGDVLSLAKSLQDTFTGELQLDERFKTASWTIFTHKRPTKTSRSLTHKPLVTIDLATTRQEYYETPAALPITGWTFSTMKDLERRDFTINAIAVSLHPLDFGHLTDVGCGFRDIQLKQLQVLHPLSFRDDPTRIFRAARFAARLDFQLHPQTRQLVRLAVQEKYLTYLSLSRLGAELRLIFAEEQVLKALKLLYRWQIFPFIHPQLERQGKVFLAEIQKIVRLQERLAANKKLRLPPPSELYWLTLARCLTLQARRQLLGLTIQIKNLHSLWLYSPDNLKHCLIRLEKAKTIQSAVPCLQPLSLSEIINGLTSNKKQACKWLWWWLTHAKDLKTKVTGDTLLALGYPAGPALKRALAAAKIAAYQGLNAKQQLKAAKEVLDKMVERGQES